MMSGDGVPFADLVAAMERRATPLATETALFVLLEAATALTDDPRGIGPGDVRITADGEVRIDAALRASEEAVALDSLARLMDRYVVPMTPGGRALLGRVRTGEVRSVGTMVAEIQALLVPLNRGAARRVMGRLVREYGRTAGRDGGDALESGHGAEALLSRDPGAASTPMPSREPRDAVDTQPEGPPASIPPIPPPPRLGSLVTLAARSTSAVVDTEPDAPLLQARETDELPSASGATDPDADTVIPMRVRRRSRNRLYVLLGLVGVVGAGLALWLGHLLPHAAH